MNNPLLTAIRWYQKRGGSRHFFNTECNYTPSCSEYAYQAISNFGTWDGLKLAYKRIRRCNNPDCTHKIHDPVPHVGPPHVN